MANYYTLASFIIPCSSEQAATAVKALKQVDCTLSKQAELIVRKPHSESFSAEEKIIRRCFLNHPDQASDHPVKKLEWYFSVESCGNGLWVCHDETINTDHAAIFTQAVLAAFDLPHLVEIEASYTCSKPRIDAFGGHVCVVTQNFIHQGGWHDFLEAEYQAHQQKERYFICDITEVNGEYEYTSHFLMKCDHNNDPEKCLDKIFIGYRGEGDKEEDDFVWYPGGIAAKNPCMQEITPAEFWVMKTHLGVLRH